MLLVLNRNHFDQDLLFLCVSRTFRLRIDLLNGELLRER